MPYDIEVTDDGSFSLRDLALGELYHNQAGAYTEALKNYVEPAVASNHLAKRDHVRLLDVCFGIGYNSLALIEHFLANKPGPTKIEVLALENNPSVIKLLPQVIEQPYFPKINAVLTDCHIDLYSLNSFSTFNLSQGKLEIELKLVKADIREELPVIAKGGARFDWIFHDPFSAKKACELWTIDLFHLFKGMLQPEGAVLTYSSAAAVRRALQQEGFHLYRTFALGGKSGGTLAALNEKETGEFLYPLTESEQAKIGGRSGVPYRDPDFNWTRDEIIKRRAKEQDDLFPTSGSGQSGVI